MRFSERYDYKPVREIIQKESMDDALKNSIWNVFKQIIIEQGKFTKHSSLPNIQDYNLYTFFRAYWITFLKKPLDEMPNTVSNIQKDIYQHFFNQLKWYEIYDLIEFTIDHLPSDWKKTRYQETLIKLINAVLERENSAYRIIENKIILITSEQEIQSIEEALESTNPYSGVQQHLNQALKLMSDRQNPDYRNSIKESVSALEGMCQKILKKDKVTLGDAIGQIEKQYPIHPALKASIKSLYGYTSDADGIRHAMLDESNLSYIDAKFMLVACTNFINYLIDKTKNDPN
ncbi:AbiJ-NTD4 domain-containing protein [Acinetobacter lwoffii]|uniref:AbiJ-NTD4 domain-containing protein n=1 Tax=Acinetobacter lwoffii TaxID=28090 RepID=UPI002096B3FF|nr:hypothetical protein [Acinetobacter lwoffii]MCO8081596.1 hypothetical protein [Acinetobacter lwoffii]